MAESKSTPAPTGISPDVLLRQVQILLNAADEANDSGRFETFALQRQAREVLAEAIDRLSIQPDQYRQDIWDSFPHRRKPAELSAAITERQAALADMKAAGSDLVQFSAASRREAELAARIRHLRQAASPRLSVHPYHETQE